MHKHTFTHELHTYKRKHEHKDVHAHIHIHVHVHAYMHTCRHELGWRWRVGQHGPGSHMGSEAQGCRGLAGVEDVGSTGNAEPKDHPNYC